MTDFPLQIVCHRFAAAVLIPKIEHLFLKIYRFYNSDLLFSLYLLNKLKMKQLIDTWHMSVTITPLSCL